jgi:hypothetical protein
MYYNYIELFEPVISTVCPEFGDEHKIFKMTIMTDNQQYDIGLLNQAQSFCEMLVDIFDEDNVEIDFNPNPDFFPTNNFEKRVEEEKSALIGDTLYMMGDEEDDFNIDKFIVCDYSVKLDNELVCLFSTLTTEDIQQSQIIERRH